MDFPRLKEKKDFPERIILEHLIKDYPLDIIIKTCEEPVLGLDKKRVKYFLGKRRDFPVNKNLKEIFNKGKEIIKKKGKKTEDSFQCVETPFGGDLSCNYEGYEYKKDKIKIVYCRTVFKDKSGEETLYLYKKNGLLSGNNLVFSLTRKLLKKNIDIGVYSEGNWKEKLEGLLA